MPFNPSDYGLVDNRRPADKSVPPSTINWDTPPAETSVSAMPGPTGWLREPLADLAAVGTGLATGMGQIGNLERLGTSWIANPLTKVFGGTPDPEQNFLFPSSEDLLRMGREGGIMQQSWMVPQSARERITQEALAGGGSAAGAAGTTPMFPVRPVQAIGSGVAGGVAGGEVRHLLPGTNLLSDVADVAAGVATGSVLGGVSALRQRGPNAVENVVNLLGGRTSLEDAGSTFQNALERVTQKKQPADFLNQVPEYPLLPGPGGKMMSRADSQLERAKQAANDYNSKLTGSSFYSPDQVDRIIQSQQPGQLVSGLLSRAKKDSSELAAIRNDLGPDVADEIGRAHLSTNVLGPGGRIRSGNWNSFPEASKSHLVSDPDLRGAVESGVNAPSGAMSLRTMIGESAVGAVGLDLASKIIGSHFGLPDLGGFTELLAGAAIPPAWHLMRRTGLTAPTYGGLGAGGAIQLPTNP